MNEVDATLKCGMKTMSGIFNKSNDQGVYSAESRETSYMEFSPHGSNYDSIILFKFNSNEVQQWIPSQSYLVVKVAMAGLASTQFRPEHITSFPLNRYFARMSHTINGVRVASTEQPSDYVDGWADAHTNRDANESHAGLFNKDPWVISTQNAGALTHVTAGMRPQSRCMTSRTVSPAESMSCS